jgi:hypothetical protein
VYRSGQGTAGTERRPRRSNSRKSFGNQRFPSIWPARPRKARRLPYEGAEDETVSQRIIEMLIGRLLTDERFRAEFLENPEQTLADLRGRGAELSGTEIEALLNTDPALWSRTATGLDPRLQKASLKNEVALPAKGEKNHV